MVQSEGSDLFSYTDTQKHEIITSIQHLPKYDSSIDFIADLTLRVLNHEIEEQDFIRETAEKHAKLNCDIMEAIDALANALTAEMRAFESNFDPTSFVAEFAGIAKVPLETIYQAAHVQAT